MPSLGRIRIGISGWTYAGWRGRFFPETLPHKKELSYAANIFRAIEINGSFYSLQRPGTFAKWAAETPDDFVFCRKSFAIHHSRAAAQGNSRSARQFLCVGTFAARPKTRPIPVAGSTKLQVRREPNRMLLQASAAGHGIRAGPGAPPRQARERSLADESIRTPASSALHGNPKQELRGA